MSQRDQRREAVATACVLAQTEETCRTPASFRAICHACGGAMSLCVYDAMVVECGVIKLVHPGCDSTEVKLEMITTE